MWKSRRLWFGLAVTILFLFLLFRPVDLDELLDALRGADYVYLVPAIVVYFAAFWFRALRWQLLLVRLGRVGTARLYRLMMIGYAANNILPVRLGELVRAYLLRRTTGISGTAGLGTIVVERVVDGLTLMGFLSVASLTVALSPALSGLARFAALGFAAAGLGLLLFAAIPRLPIALAGLLFRYVPTALRSRLLGLLSLFLEGISSLRDPRALAAIFGLSVLVWLGEAAMYFLVALSFHLSLPVATVLLATAASNLATSVPSSQGGIGPFEYFTTQTLLLFGVAGSTATAYALVLHAALLLPVIVAGFLLLWLEGVSLGEALRVRTRAQLNDASLSDPPERA